MHRNHTFIYETKVKDIKKSITKLTKKEYQINTKRINEILYDKDSFIKKLKNKLISYMERNKELENKVKFQNVNVDNEIQQNKQSNELPVQSDIQNLLNNLTKEKHKLNDIILKQNDMIKKLNYENTLLIKNKNIKYKQNKIQTYEYSKYKPFNNKIVDLNQSQIQLQLRKFNIRKDTSSTSDCYQSEYNSLRDIIIINPNGTIHNHDQKLNKNLNENYNFNKNNKKQMFQYDENEFNSFNKSLRNSEYKKSINESETIYSHEKYNSKHYIIFDIINMFMNNVNNTIDKEIINFNKIHENDQIMILKEKLNTIVCELEQKISQIHELERQISVNNFINNTKKFVIQFINMMQIKSEINKKTKKEENILFQNEVKIINSRRNSLESLCSKSSLDLINLQDRKQSDTELINVLETSFEEPAFNIEILKNSAHFNDNENNNKQQQIHSNIKINQFLNENQISITEQIQNNNLDEYLNAKQKIIETNQISNPKTIGYLIEDIIKMGKLINRNEQISSGLKLYNNLVDSN